MSARAALGLTDLEFDRLLGGPAQAHASRFWTPAAVAELAAERLVELGARRVLDVGSGVGKFCLIAAASQTALSLHGIERRAWLVEEARRVRAQLGLDNTHFERGDAFATPWSEYDALYFFNPFSENLAPAEERLDGSVELSRERFLAEAQRIDLALRLLPPGRLLVTYHGVAAPIPSSYDLLGDEPVGTNRLRVWRRAARRHGPWVYLETEEGVVCADRKQLTRVLLANHRLG